MRKINDLASLRGLFLRLALEAEEEPGTEVVDESCCRKGRDGIQKCSVQAVQYYIQKGEDGERGDPPPVKTWISCEPFYTLHSFSSSLDHSSHISRPARSIRVQRHLLWPYPHAVALSLHLLQDPLLSQILGSGCLSMFYVQAVAVFVQVDHVYHALVKDDMTSMIIMNKPTGVFSFFHLSCSACNQCPALSHNTIKYFHFLSQIPDCCLQIVEIHRDEQCANGRVEVLMVNDA